MENRECPYCHKKISLRNCVKYVYRGTAYSTTCNHCGNRVKLIKEPYPFMYAVFAGGLSAYLPMQFFLYIAKLTFVQSLLYTLPIALICLAVCIYFGFTRLYFRQDM